MASGGLGALSVDLLLETVQWLAGLNKAEFAAQKFGDEIEKRFNKMTGAAVDALKGIAAGMVAGFAVDRVVGFVNETQKAADALDEMAQKTGTSVAFLAQMSVTAEMAGTSVEAVAKSIVKFNEATVKAFADPNSQPAKIFDALGVSVRDASGALKSSETLYAETAAKLGGMEDGAIKTAAAIKLAGKAGAELIPTWNALARETDVLREAKKKYGDEMARLAPLAGALEEQQAIMTTNSKTLAATLGQQLIPYFTEMYAQWNDMSKAGGTLATVATAVVNAFKGIVIVVDTILTGLKQVVVFAIGASEALGRLVKGDLKGAKAIWSDTMQTMDDTTQAWGKRLESLLDPLKAATGETKKLTTASDALGRAVGDADKGTEKLAKEAARRAKEFNDAWVKAIDAQIEADRQLALATNKNALDREKAEKKAAEESAAAWVKFIDAQIDNDKQLALSAHKLADERAKALNKLYTDVFKGIDDAGERAMQSLFDGTRGGWRDMLGDMAKDFKKILADFIYKQFARPIVLNLLANMGGGVGQYASSLLGQEGGQGMLGSIPWGSMASGAYDWFAGEGASSALMAEYGIGGAAGGTAPGALASAGYGIAGGVFGYGAATLYGAGDRGVANATSYGAAGATAGAYIGSIVPVIGTAIGAAVGAIIGTIVGISTDPDPDAMRQAVFGSTAGAEGLTDYQYTSALGSFGISDTKWFSDEEMGPALQEFMAGMKNLDNAIASTLSAEELDRLRARLADASKEYEFGMEHTGTGGAADIVKDRLRVVVDEIAPELITFFDTFSGGVEELSTVISGYLSLRNVGDFDAGNIVEEINKENEARLSQMEMYQKGISALNELVSAWDGSADSTSALTQSLSGFQEATIQMILAIDAAAASMHKMFMDTADDIRQSMMTEEERYQFLQERSAGMFDALLLETDPAKIQEMAEQINADINAAWGMLSDEQKELLGQSFLEKLESVDQTVADKMAGLRGVVVEDSDSMMATIAARLDEIFKTGDAVAARQLEAADTQLAAANTPIQVVVTVQNDSGLVSEAG